MPCCLAAQQLKHAWYGSRCILYHGIIIIISSSSPILIIWSLLPQTRGQGLSRLTTTLWTQQRTFCLKKRQSPQTLEHWLRTARLLVYNDSKSWAQLIRYWTFWPHRSTGGDPERTLSSRLFFPGFWWQPDIAPSSGRSRAERWSIAQHALSDRLSRLSCCLEQKPY